MTESGLARLQAKTVEIARLWAFILSFLLLSGTASVGQDNSDPELRPDWDQTALQAERLIESANVNLGALTRVRDQLATQRQEATELADTGSVRARRLQAQLDALGPAPDDGSTEPTELEQRRLELVNALAEANAPALAAREAAERADLLIGELDGLILRAKEAHLLERLPAPILPSNWYALPEDLSTVIGGVFADLSTVAASSDQVQRFRSAAPISLVLFVAGLALIFLGEPLLTARLTSARNSAQEVTRRRILALSTVLARLIVQVLGLSVVISAFALILPEMRLLRHFAEAVLGVVVALLAAQILGHVLFAPRHPELRIFKLSDEVARSGYRLSLLLGLFVALHALMSAILADFSIKHATVSTFSFVIVLSGALPVLLFGSFVKSISSGEAGDGIWIILGSALKALAIVSTLAAAVGYVNLAKGILVPTVFTIGLASVVLYFRSLLIGLVQHSLYPSPANEDQDALLLSFFISTALAIASIPALALVWGASTNAIAETWYKLANGFEIGDIRISIGNLFMLLVVFAAGILITRWLRQFLQNSFLPRTKIDRGAKSSIVTFVGYLGTVIAGLAALSAAGINLSSVAYIAGALSVGIGFGMQNIVSNFVSGIILLIERPIQEGDWIEVSGQSGVVKKIAVRSTRIQTFDRFDVIVPNADLIAGTVKNMTLSSKEGRLVIPVGVAYGSDLDVVKDVLSAVCDGRDDILDEPAPSVIFGGLGDSSLDFELRCYLKDVNTILTTKSDLLFEIYRKLDAQGVEIPFPQRDVHLKGIESLAEAIQSIAKPDRQSRGGGGKTVGTPSGSKADDPQQ